jgi:hypothetical protein
MRRLYSRATPVLAAIGIVLLITAAISVAVGGVVLVLGPVRFTAKDPVRLITQGTLALLLSAAVGTYGRVCSRGVAWLMTGLLASFYLSLVANSSPRRIGDGHEYLAMARQVSACRPPALSEDDLRRVSYELATLGSQWTADLANPHLRGDDGRQDFPHFWLYSACVAPILAVLTLAGLHPNHAFTIFNVALLTTAAFVVLRRVQAAATLVLVAGPIIWWLDKAHIEVFTFALLALAATVWTSAPHATLLFLGLLTAQNPACGVLLVSVGGGALAVARRQDRRRVILALAVGVVTAALHPLYYLWHLGRPSPLMGSLVLEWPGITAVLTPLLDPLVGVGWVYPGLVVLVGLASAGEIRDRRIIPLAALAGLTGALLVVFSLSANINHGGSPGPSRYGIWLAPLVLTLLVPRTDRGASRRWETCLPLVAVLSLPYTVWNFQPKLPENSEEPTRIAQWLVERAPALYNPLPELFAERFGGNDGYPLVPTASAHCEKVLLSGEGTPSVRWPIPCQPLPVPTACTAAGALCYANRSRGGYEFVAPPRQPGFRYVLAVDTSWRGPRDLDWFPVPIGWDGLTLARAFTSTSAIREGSNVKRIRSFEGGGTLVAFVEPLALAPARLRVRPVAEPTDVWWVGRATRRVFGRTRLYREVWIDVPSKGETLLLILRPASVTRR